MNEEFVLAPVRWR